MLKSNVTLLSNVYINKSADPYDVEFLQHIRDYRVLKRKQNNSYGLASSNAVWMTNVQKEILKQGQPDCAYEKGTMSWGVPVGCDHMRCRCEQVDCHHFTECSKYANFDFIQRDVPNTENARIDTETASPPVHRVESYNTEEINSTLPPGIDIASNPTNFPEPDAAFNPISFLEQEIIPGPEIEILPITDCSKHANSDFIQRDVPNTENARIDTETASPSVHRVESYNTKEINPILPPEVDIASNPINFPEPDAAFNPISSPEQEISPRPEIEILPKEKPEESLEAFQNVTESDTQVVEQEAIINAPIDDRMWINAGPGTGKTYTVIQRLKKLLATDIEGAILVLCFSRNAVQLIRDRLVAELGFGALSYIEDGSLVIRTFDSFATYMLEDELNASWNYSKRIEEFIKMLHRNPGALKEMFGYLIVDEIQDTVGVRARMLLTMLDELDCGVLLLGDRCQAIFDWTIRDTADMTFALLTSELSHRNFKRFELEGNRRQSKELARMGQKLREGMLNSDESGQELAIDRFKSWLRDKWKSYNTKALPQLLSGSNDLILCKTNGEAARISQQLFDATDSVEHAMKQSSNHRTLSPWIAKLLSGCDGHYLSKEAFCKNGTDYDITDIETKWTALKSLDNHPHASILHVREVLDALLRLDSVPECCLNNYSNCAIVSTVHRAKGSEAEHVFWLDTPLVYDGQREQDGALSDALNAAYVAVTRAKSDIHLLDWNKKHYLRLVNENRWIETGISKNKKQYCKGIAFLPEDTDPNSFATEEIQTVLSCLERGMPVTLFPNESTQCCDIFFDGQMIGSTSRKFTEDLFAGFAETNGTKNWPTSIPNVYIASIVTIVCPNAAGIDEQLSATGCWLGIELGGFPMLEWY